MLYYVTVVQHLMVEVEGAVYRTIRFVDKIISNWLFFSLCLTVCLVMASFGWQVTSPEIGKDLFFLFGLCFIGIGLLLHSFSESRSFFTFSFLPLLISFFVIQFVSGIVASYPFVSSTRMVHLLLVFIFFLSVLLVKWTFRRLQSLLSVLTSLNFFLCLYGFAQYSGLDPFQWTGFEGRIFSMLGHPNIFAAFLIFSIPVIFVFIQSSPSVKMRYFGWISLFSAVTALILTRSRSAWVALVVITLLALIFFRSRISISLQWKKIIWTLIPVFLLFLLVYFDIALFDRVRSLLSMSDPSVSSRILIYKNVFSAICASPFFGWGTGTFQAVFPQYQSAELLLIPPFTETRMLYHAHNEYLELALENGLAGLLFFAGLLYFIIRALYKAVSLESHKRTIVSGIGFGILGVLFQNIVSVSLRFLTTQVIFWLGTAILLSITEGFRNEDQKGAEEFRVQPNRFLIIFTRFLIVFMIVIVAVPVWRNFTAERFVYRAENSLEQKDFPTARKLSSHAIHLNPSSIVALNTLGEANLRMERWDAAYNAFLMVLHINPFHPLSHYHLALVKYMQSDLTGALNHATQAYRQRPNSWQVEELIGEIRLREGNLIEAEKWFFKATEHSSSNRNAIYNLGKIAALRGHYKIAFDYYSRLLKLDSNTLDFWRDISVINSQWSEGMKRRKVPQKENSDLSSQVLHNKLSIYCIESRSADTVTPSLEVSQVLSQSFQFECPHLNRILIKTATYHHQISPSYYFSLYRIEDGERVLIEKQFHEGLPVNDNEWLGFDFNGIEIEPGRYCFELTPGDETSCSYLHFWVKLRGMYKEGDLNIGRIKTGSDLQFAVE